MTEKNFDAQSLGEKIIKVLKTIFDPEIPVDIYELGLIYDVFVNEDFDAKVLMTLTSPNCPVAESLPAEVEQKVKSIKGINQVEVEMTFDENVSMLSLAFYKVIMICGPILGLALAIGLLIGIFQAATSINEMTLSFVPKVIVVLIGIAFLGNFFMVGLSDYFSFIFDQISGVGI